MKSCIKIGCLLCLWALALAGCGDKLEAHLSKFMEAKSERPTEFGNPPDAYSLAQSDEVSDRLAGLSFEEVAHRLGAHRYRAKVSFRFKTDKSYTSLREEALIVQAANGDFRVKVDNDSGQGYELLLSGDKLYTRTRYGSFHERSMLDRIHLTQRDKAYQGWGAIYRLFRGRLTFSKHGLARHFGRDAIKFGIGLSRSEPRLPGTPEQAKVPPGVSQYVLPIEPTPSAQDRWRDKAQPQSASGMILVDMDAGMPLKVTFEGTLAWQNEEGQDLDLSITAEIESDGFGNPPSIAPPAADEIKPAPQRIQVDTHPLDFFFGKGFTSSLGPPAGVARKSSAEQKADKADKEEEKSGGAPSNQ